MCIQIRTYVHTYVCRYERTCVPMAIHTYIPTLYVRMCICWIRMWHIQSTNPSILYHCTTVYVRTYVCTLCTLNAPESERIFPTTVHYVRTYVRTYICTYVFIMLQCSYVCTCICMYVRTYIRIYVCTPLVYVLQYTYVCMHVYIH